MKAWVLEKYGDKRGLQLKELAEPTLNEDEVLVKVKAASVNVLDTKIAKGEFKAILPYRVPVTLGHDVAGVVVKVGTKVHNFKSGDEVYSRADDFHIGTFAEYIAIKEASLAIKPPNLTMEEAASIPLVGLTSWQALIEKGQLKKGQKVFIQAGSGGVGTIAIQLAKHIGAFVATTTSASNFDLVKKLGADLVIDYKKDDLETILKDYDVVLNSQDNVTLMKSLNILKPGGILISISGPPDPLFGEQIKATWLVKGIMKLVSSKVRKEAIRKKVNYSFLFMKANGMQLREITALIESGIIKPVIDQVFNFDQTNNALEYIEMGRAKGKVIIKL